MGKYFGTDGIRGVANEGLTIDIAYKVGSFLADYYKGQKICIGKDTRLSSSMFESALALGISAHGGKAYLLGYTSTPCLAYVVSHEDFACGIMISASHNPYHDNGIKIFDKSGLKLDAGIEKKIEDYIDSKEELPLAKNEAIGSIIDYHEGVEDYLSWLDGLFDYDLSDMKIALDLANGSSCFTAERALAKKGASLSIIHDQPDGININNNCGSTHLNSLKEHVKNGDFDIAFAFDGDADRVLVIDHNGEEVDGDKIMYVLAKYLKKHGLLENNTLVTTVMSNIGLYKALDRANIAYDIVSVGDKNVADSMVKNDFAIGGEQSGHIINKHHGLFGDGLKTAMNILAVIKESNQSIEELCEDVKIYPQLLINQRVKDKNIVLNDDEIKKLIDKIAKELGSDGRILVRPSGTEPLIRVMVEADSKEKCHDLVYQVIDLINAKGYGE